MKGLSRVALVLGLVAGGAVSVEAAESSSLGGEAPTEIVVANEYQTQVLVYVEDSGGRLQLLGRVSHGEVKLFEAPTDVTELGDFRVKVYPISIPDPWSRSNDRGIKTHALNLQDGEMVIALLHGEEVTLKKIYRERGRVRLQPANHDMAPIYVREEALRIQGVVVGLMRRY